MRAIVQRFIVLLLMLCSGLTASAQSFVPTIVGNWWQVAGIPDVSPYNTANQQPVDFGIWQAADGTWQIWSCIRNTSFPNRTRLFHGWEGGSLFDTNWAPLGITMTSDTSLGEIEGGLQAPHVIKEGDTYHMLYGTWDHIARATSTDGKTFSRVIQNDGTTNMFGDGEINPRDTMTIEIDETYYTYYTTRDQDEGRVFLRTSPDLNTFSARQEVAFGGSAGTNWWEAECSFVFYHEASGDYFLFRTQKYGNVPETRVYRSSNPTYFGIGADADNYPVAQLPVAAPELIEHDGKLYITALNTGLDGIRIAELDFIDPTAPVSFQTGGMWQITARRMDLSAPNSFTINDVSDASALLALESGDPRLAVDISTESTAINFNHVSGQVGRFANDDPFPGGGGNHFALRATGMFYLEESAVVTLGLTVNDGAMLKVDNQQVVLDDTADAVSDHFATLNLAAGPHEVELIYFQQQFSAVLELYAATTVGTFSAFSGTNAPQAGWQLLQAAALGISGDYNGDGFVDAVDYVVWRDHFGSTTALPNDASPGFVTQEDYEVWRSNFGRSLVDPPAETGTRAVPEPGDVIGFLGMVLVVTCGRRRIVGRSPNARRC